MKIYLITTDGHQDSLYFSSFATDKESLIELLKEVAEDYNSCWKNCIRLSSIKFPENWETSYCFDIEFECYYDQFDEVEEQITEEFWESLDQWDKETKTFTVWASNKVGGSR